MHSVVHVSALFIALGALVTLGCSSAPAEDDAAGSSEAAQTQAGTTRIVLGGNTDAAARRLSVAFDAAFGAVQFGAGGRGTAPHPGQRRVVSRRELLHLHAA